jgi:hypothetical protein
LCGQFRGGRMRIILSSLIVVALATLAQAQEITGFGAVNGRTEAVYEGAYQVSRTAFVPGWGVAVDGGAQRTFGWDVEFSQVFYTYNKGRFFSGQMHSLSSGLVFQHRMTPALKNSLILYLSGGPGIYWLTDVGDKYAGYFDEEHKRFVKRPHRDISINLGGGLKIPISANKPMGIRIDFRDLQLLGSAWVPMDMANRSVFRVYTGYYFGF